MNYIQDRQYYTTQQHMYVTGFRLIIILIKKEKTSILIATKLAIHKKWKALIYI